MVRGAAGINPGVVHIRAFWQFRAQRLLAGSECCGTTASYAHCRHRRA
jgi:hypothetical protein